MMINDAIFAGQVLQIVDSPGGVTNLPSPPGLANIPYERVIFPNGDISATLDGVLSSGAPKGYVQDGRSGQTLEIGTPSNGESLLVTVHTANGQALSLSGENGLIASNLYVGLPESGDFYVTVSLVTTPENPNLGFTMTFFIQ